MKNYLEIIMVVSSIIAIRSGTEENLQKKYELWKYLKKKDRKLYYELKWGILGRTMNLPGKSGRMELIMEPAGKEEGVKEEEIITYMLLF